MDKPSVRKAGGRWLATRSLVGFSPIRVMRAFSSHRAALAWVLGTGGAGTAQVELAGIAEPVSVDEGWPTVIR